MNWFETKLKEAKPLKTTRNGKFTINYIDPSIMGLNSSFGYIVGNQIYIKSDLSPRVENFVIQHELYHAKDQRVWWGWIGKELRANLLCGLKNPFGLIATICASINRTRLVAYWHALKKVNFKHV